jgi:hypothetical protein
VLKIYKFQICLFTPSRRLSARTARAESEQAPEGAPDSEQGLSSAPPDCPMAPHVRAPTVEP